MSATELDPVLGTLPRDFTGLYAGGRWLEPKDPTSRVDVVDPATEIILTGMPGAGHGDVDRLLDAATDAQPAWAETAPRARAEVLRRAWELMLQERERFTRLIVLENGKSWADAEAEVTYAAEFFRWFSEEGVRVEGDMRRAPSGDKWIMVMHEPVGVALLVTPWNYPAAMATRKIAPALAAGCTVVLKPAAETPLTAIALIDLLERAGVPAGVLNLAVTPQSGPFVSQMLSDPRIQALSFTGSTEVGRVLLSQAAQNVVICSMELGGNAPFLVMADADVSAAVDGFMVAKMRNGGSACTAANRIYVHNAVADQFIDGVAARMCELRMGPGIDRSNDVGALVNAKTQRSIEALVESALDDGGKLLLGGGTTDTGFFFEPTIITGVPADARILREEIFGPVAPIVRFDEPDEAIRMANDSQAGLIAYVYTQDVDAAFGAARSLRAGMVGLNRGLVSDPAAPFGGMKHSGLGREGAREGINEFLETKYVATSYR